MSLLPYWDNDLDFEVSELFSYSLDWNPISANGVYGSEMERLARAAFSVDSEFLYISGINYGLGGTMMWNEPSSGESIPLGFLLLLGYSREMEFIVYDFLKYNDQVTAGLAECRFWSKSMSDKVGKIIMLVSSLPLEDEDSFLSGLIDKIESSSNKDHCLPYYAERFGFRRLFISYETDDVTSLRIFDVLRGLDLASDVLGPVPTLPMPKFIQLE